MEVPGESQSSDSMSMLNMVRLYRPASLDSLPCHLPVQKCRAWTSRSVPRFLMGFLCLVYFSSLPLGIYLLMIQQLTMEWSWSAWCPPPWSFACSTASANVCAMRSWRPSPHNTPPSVLGLIFGLARPVKEQKPNDWCISTNPRHRIFSVAPDYTSIYQWTPCNSPHIVCRAYCTWL